jgi:hypothetical protein
MQVSERLAYIPEPRTLTPDSRKKAGEGPLRNENPHRDPLPAGTPVQALVVAVRATGLLFLF